MNGETMDQTMADLTETALRVKAERDEAVKLLKEALLYSHIGADGVFKSKVRAFLEPLGVIAAYADAMAKRDQLERLEGRSAQTRSGGTDTTTDGRPLRHGS